MKITLTACFFLIRCALYAQQPIIPLYDGVPPGSEKWVQEEIITGNTPFTGVRNVVNPSLTAYLPEKNKATGTAVIVAPGGGFRVLSWDNEGTKVAEWLQAQGIAAFVLKYRLVNTGQTEEDFQKKMQDFGQEIERTAKTNDPRELLKNPEVAKVIEFAKEDGRQAIKYVRAHAAKYNINPERIGLLGFSAGGILSIGVALRHNEESRPDFVAPIYAISLDELNIPSNAPPMFYACAADDGFVATMAVNIYLAWKNAGNSIEFHVYSKGGHGFGMLKQGLPVDHWNAQFLAWLTTQGLLTSKENGKN